MNLFSSILQTLQVISSIMVIVLVLLQQGKGADMGAAFGSGSAGSVFGSAGAANFLSRATKWAAIVFFASTGGLAWVAHHPSGSPLDSGLMSGFSSSAPEQSGTRQGPAVPGAGSAVPAAPSAVPSVPSADAASSEVPEAISSESAGADSAASVPSLAAPAADSVPDQPVSN